MEHSRDPKGLQQPTRKHLELIKWLPNEQGETYPKKMRLVKNMACKWHSIAALLDVGGNEIEVIANPGSGKTPEQCLYELLDKHWTENGEDEYQRTWQGLHTLLVDVELSETANKLKEALNSKCNSVRGTYHTDRQHENSPSDETSSSTAGHSVSRIPLLPLQEQAKVLDSCTANIYELLDVSKMAPLLQVENLLSEDADLTVMEISSDQEKISRILAILRERRDSLRKFVKCLRKSQSDSNLKLASIIEDEFDVSNTRGSNTDISRFSWCYLLLRTLILMSLLLLMYLYVFHPGSFGFLNLYHSKSLPHPSNVFVGREQEMEDLSHLLDFSHSESDIRIINIVGSPGFGKSTLAIQLGNRLVMEGIVIHYVNLADYQDQKIQQTLTEKILKVAGEPIKTPNFDKLLNWARNSFWNTLIIVDNCDDVLQTQKDSFFDALVQLVEQTRELKVLVTSREVTTQIEYFKRYRLFELSTRSSCELLNKKLPPGANLMSSEVEEIAKLTGNSPLALQITGALFSLPTSPNPSEVIKNLQDHPIPELSREELPIKHNINVSIDLSYRYLTPEMQKIGCFLANFPGSFDRKAATYIFMAHEELISMSCDHFTSYPVWENITVTLDSLIHRSLIEYDPRTERYQFHRLIREFFIDMQLRNVVSDLKRFIDNFCFFYSQKLLSFNNTFQTNYKQALADFHTERHNFQKLLESLNTDSQYSMHSFFSICHAIVTLRDSHHLQNFFTDQELVFPLQSALRDFDDIIEHLQSNTLNLSQSMLSIFRSEDIQIIFIQFVYQLSEIEERLFGPQTAMETCQKRKEIIDRFNITANSTVAVAYMNFYTKLSDYHITLNNHSEAAYYYMKSLTLRTEKIKSWCYMQSNCSYYELGELSYYELGNNKKSAQLFELSYTHEQHFGLDRLFLLFHIIRVNTILNEQVKVDYYNRELVKEVKMETMNITDPYKFHIHTPSLLIVIRHLSGIREADLVTALEGKLLEGIMEVGAHHSVPSTPEQTLDVLEHYYQRGDYNKTHSLSLFILESLQRIKVPDKEVDEIKVRIQLLMAKATLYSGNYSQGMNEMEELLDFISDDQQQDVYKDVFKEACFYLIPRLRFIPTCYPWVTSHPVAVITMLAKSLFVIPLDPYSNSYEHITNDTHSLLKSQIPELEWRSNATDLSLSNEYTLQELLAGVTSSFKEHITSAARSLLRWWFGVISTGGGFVFQFTIIRLIFNVCSVFIRLYLALFTAFLMHSLLIVAPYNCFRLFIIARLYRFCFVHQEKIIFPSTVFLLNMLFFLDTVEYVMNSTIMFCLIYLITGMNLFRLRFSRGLIVNGYDYNIVLQLLT